MTWGKKAVTTASLIIGSLVVFTLFTGCILINGSNNRASREVEQSIKFYYSKIRVGQDVDSVKSFLRDDFGTNFTHDADGNRIYFNHSITKHNYSIIKSKICGEIHLQNDHVLMVSISDCLTGP